MPLQSETLLTAGADNASGTHHPGHYIRSVCAARDRLRTKGNVAMAGRPAPADQPGRGRETGRCGLPAESVLRCALLKQQRQLSYEELAFHLEDSASFRAFARLPLRWSPKKSVLQRTISAIRPETWEVVNRALIASAQQDKLEQGAMVRIDSTVTAALVHEPSDSALLWDAVRLMRRLLRQAAALPGAPTMRWHDRRRMAKRCASEIAYSRGNDNRRR